MFKKGFKLVAAISLVSLGVGALASCGKGEVAKKIIEAAKIHKIPIKEDSDLVEILSKVDINQEIPPNLYKAVAEVFSFLYRTTKLKN